MASRGGRHLLLFFSIRLESSDSRLPVHLPLIHEVLIFLFLNKTLSFPVSILFLFSIFFFSSFSINISMKFTFIPNWKRLLLAKIFFFNITKGDFPFFQRLFFSLFRMNSSSSVDTLLNVSSIVPSSPLLHPIYAVCLFFFFFLFLFLQILPEKRLSACVIPKNMSTVLVAILCMLFDPIQWKERGFSLTQDVNRSDILSFYKALSL